MNIRLLIYSLFLLAGLALSTACGPEPPDDDNICMELACGYLADIPCDPQAYTYNIPIGLPLMPTQVTNGTTEEGIALGRRLFYDPILSKDSTMSCSSCHLPAGSFTDNEAVSIGVDDIAGTRSSMSLLNVGYYDTGLFWDGRVMTLQEQALLPVEDPIELHDTWPNVIDKLQRHSDYPELFRKAFCIDYTDEITNSLAANALAQFESIMHSSGNSKYDRVLRGEDFLTDEEDMGLSIFFDNPNDLPDGECGHCHNIPLFTTNEFFNNGIDQAASYTDFIDIGLGAVTGDTLDYGKFRAPTLRNITSSGPYMHDGRFATLEEVIDHYNAGGQSPSYNKDILIKPLGLTEEQKAALLAFLKTLDDPDFMNNPALQSPF